MAKRRKAKRGNGTGSVYKRAPNGAYIASWTTHDGKRKERSTKTTDLAVAERILASYVNDEAMRARGLYDATAERHADEGRKPIGAHVGAYIQSCQRSGHTAQHVFQKRRHLERLIADSDVTRLAELTSDALERHLFRRKQDGKAARTINASRQAAVAFANWCVKTGRMPSNPLAVVAKLNEEMDRKRVRRPLTDVELVSLLGVAQKAGRKAWYLCAALAGLRRGDMVNLEWRDVNFDEGTLTIRNGKSGRTDVVPLHPQLADELLARRGTAMPMARVFPHPVSNTTRLRDFLNAGLARKEVVRDANGEPVMVKRHDRPSKYEKVRIVTTDDEGREIDLHALRTTLGTNLARSGVTPQVAQRIMRHADYRTTLAHYTVLGLNDTSAAIERIAAIEAPATVAVAVGGTDLKHQQHPRQPGGGNSRSVASGREVPTGRKHDPAVVSPRYSAGNCENSRELARDCEQRATRLERATFSLEG